MVAELKNKVAVVTGGASGIGRGIIELMVNNDGAFGDQSRILNLDADGFTRTTDFGGRGTRRLTIRGLAARASALRA